MKTSTKITTLFSFFNALWLIFVIITINIVYFLMWFSYQEEQALKDVEQSYKTLIEEKLFSWSWELACRQYILTKPSYIITKNWEAIMSDNIINLWITREDTKNFYVKKRNKVYFINKIYFSEIWEVWVAQDVTDFILWQKTFSKAGFIVLFIAIMLYFPLWRFFTNSALKNLKCIISQTKNLDIESDFKKIKINAQNDDEIKILAESLNKTLTKIKTQSENQKQFISHLAHEFKTPLMWITSEVDLSIKMQEKWLPQEKVWETLKKIKNKTLELNSIIETLFFVSRLQEWVSLCSYQSSNFSEILEWVLEDFKGKFKVKEIQLKSDIEKNVLLHIDETSLKIMARNLVWNALKYTDSWWKVEVLLDKKCFKVKDSWIWISEDHLQKIWENFYRENLRWEGFWLWLYIVKKLASIYSFSINVESKVWEWSTFWVDFNN